MISTFFIHKTIKNSYRQKIRDYLRLNVFNRSMDSAYLNLENRVDSIEKGFSNFRAFCNHHFEYIHDSLDELRLSVRRIELTMVTKDDFYRELSNYATKEDLREALSNYATKEDLRREVDSLRQELATVSGLLVRIAEKIGVK